MYHVNPLTTSPQPTPVHVVYSGIKVSLSHCDFGEFSLCILLAVCILSGDCANVLVCFYVLLFGFPLECRVS